MMDMDIHIKKLKIHLDQALDLKNNAKIWQLFRCILYDDLVLSNKLNSKGS